MTNFKIFLFQIPCWTPRWITVSNNILNTLNGYLVIAYWAVQHSLVCHASHHNSFAIQCKLNEGWNCDRYAAIISMYALVISCFILNRLLQLQIAFRQEFKISNVKNEILLKNDSWRTQVLRRKLIYEYVRIGFDSIKNQKVKSICIVYKSALRYQNVTNTYRDNLLFRLSCCLRLFVGGFPSSARAPVMPAK